MDNTLHNRRDEASQILSRLLSSLPAATFEMETFAQLTGVVATRQIPTAAMECTHRPRLLINPDFVAKFCRRDEHLFMLVMHELWHVMLAHTSLYPNVTQAQNIAFDAIINAGLSRQFNKPEYRGFFGKINPPDKFPHMLLRPPEGWPHNPVYRDDLGPPGTARVMRQLYPPPHVRRPAMPFYNEILDLIKEDMRARGMCMDGVPVLLGDHDAERSRRTRRNKYLKDAMGRIVKKWPTKPGQFGPPGSGGELDDWKVDPRVSSTATRQAFSNVLRRCLGPSLGQYRRKERLPIPGISGKSVLPNARDRLMPARQMLGAPMTLWSQPGQVRARVPERKVRSHVYLDVSGSMSRTLPYLLNLLTPYVMRGQADIFQFSTEVEHLPLKSLNKGIVQSTGGTNIDCVMEHLIEHGTRVSRALILTDGYTGKPRPEHKRRVIDENDCKIYLVLPAESQYKDDLEHVSHSVTVLPRLRG